MVLVDPKHQCNVGFIARVMKNFGFTRLFIAAEEFKIETKAYDCSGHARDVLEKARFIALHDVNDLFDIIIGTTAKTDQREGSPRLALEPGTLKEKIKGVGGEKALLFGREDTGLTNQELERCDMVLNIPSDPAYATLNISHAVAVVLWELFKEEEAPIIREAKGSEKEALLRRLDELLETIKYPNYKKKVAKRILRNIMGRAGVSGREAHTLAGIFKEANDEIKRRG